MKRLLPLSNNTANSASPRILIVRVGAMGDVLHGMPAVAALRRARPNAHIAWAIEPRWSPLLQVSRESAAQSAEMPLVNGSHLVTVREWSKHPLSLATLRSISALRRELHGGNYDIAIDLQGTIRSSVIARMSGAPRVFGSTHPREGAAQWFYTERVPLTTTHVVEQAAELVSHALETKLTPAPLSLPIDIAAERWCDLNAATSEKTIVLAPTAGWGAKQWPADRFGTVARALAQRGYRVLINAAPTGTDAIAHAVAVASGGTAQPVPCTLPQLIALLRRVSLVIAGDSGPLHLAAALNKPVVALFGPTDPARNGPWATTSRVLRHAASVTNHHRHAAVETGLAQISVDEVLTAAYDLLERDERD